MLAGCGICCDFRSLVMLQLGSNSRTRHPHEAAQIPGVSTHFNTPANVLRNEIYNADVVWSLTGLDGDHDRNLADAEHFGLALLELMSAGLIPIIANVGGPVEILEKFPDSLKVNSIDELVTSTITLIGSSPAYIEKLSIQALDRARGLSHEFSERAGWMLSLFGRTLAKPIVSHWLRVHGLKRQYEKE